MAYIPHTPEDRQRMCAALGITSLEELLAPVPERVRHPGPLAVPPARPEWEVKQQLARLADANAHTEDLVSFLGGGAYDHFVPAAVAHITRRSEFATAYTPYQPEVAQGTLQAIFEFQTAIARLAGLPLANASLYDGATACAEAVILALGETRGRRVVLSEAVHPHTRSVVHTYLRGRKATIRVLKTPQGTTRSEEVATALGKKPACLVVSQPNVFGQIEDLEPLAETVHAHGGLLVVAADPIALALLEAPGQQGADIVVGEGQSLGLAQCFGGPYLGFLATRRELVRRLPGRLVGMATDRRGQRAYVMTLQTREQHIRRERATSNICTNQGLCALAATVYLSMVGKTGLKRAALLCTQKAHYLAERMSQMAGFRLRFPGPFFKEFVIETPQPPAQIIRRLAGSGLLAGIDLARLQPSWRGGLLVAVTEKRSRLELDHYLDCLKPFSARTEIARAVARQMNLEAGPTVTDAGDTEATATEARRL